MRQRAMGFAAVAAGTMLLLGSAAWAGENAWVTDTGHRVHVGGHEAMFFGEGATEIPLAELADGETRVIGLGEKQITARRRGDVVTISRSAVGDRKALDLKCTIGTDTCKVLTFDDDPERVLVIVEKASRCEGGGGDCSDVDVIALGEALAERHGLDDAYVEPGEDLHVVRIKKTVECDDAGNCQDFEEILDGGEGAPGTLVIETLGDGVDVSGPHAKMVFIRGDDQVTLRCSEGDTTMRVAPEEADDVFLCPKHSTPLEKIPVHPRVIRRKLRADRSD